METKQTASRPKGPDNSFKKCPASPPAPATPRAGSATACDTAYELTKHKKAIIIIYIG